MKRGHANDEATAGKPAVGADRLRRLLTFTLSIMSLMRRAAVIGKAGVVVVSGLAALGAALLSGMYAAVTWGGPAGGGTAVVAFAVIGLAVALTTVVALVKLSWRLRAVVGVVLLVGIVLLIPRPTCATETSSHIEC